jgi:energy-coupling factor transporter ATP-binding protein EcfA2
VEEKMSDRDIGTWKAYETWRAEINNQSPNKAFRFVKDYLDAFQKALTASDDLHANRKQILFGNHSKALEKIKNTEQNQISQITDDANAKFADLKENQNEKLNQPAKDLDQLLIVEALNRDTGDGAAGFIGAIGTKTEEETVEYTNKQMRKIYEESRQKQTEARVQLGELFERYLRALTEQLNLRIKEENLAASIGREIEMADYNTNSESELEKYAERTKALIGGYEDILDEIMSDEKIGAYRNAILSTKPIANDYECAVSVPNLVYIGDVSKNVNGEDPIPSNTVFNMLKNRAGLAFVDKPGLIAEFPVAYDINDGIALFLSYAPTEKDSYHKLLRALVLKLFMVFPPGKLEATMIDPLESGRTFAMFTRLGTSQPRIINSRIWTQERDITREIDTLRRSMETIIQNYGEDREMRVKKESFRVLAITDFPTGFNDQSLRDLQAILRMSAAVGVFVFIWSNSQEVSKIRESQTSIFSEVKNMMGVIRTEGQHLYYEGAESNGNELRIDDIGEILDSIEITEKITGILSEGIMNAKMNIDYFNDMFVAIDDPNNWFAADTIDNVALPIGIRGAKEVQRLILGELGKTEHHVLIGGQTGSGKSTLLHTMIMSALLTYAPEEVQMYLVDFKEGIEFVTYTRYNLPSLKVVAIDSEREFGLNILNALIQEMNSRDAMFKRVGESEISRYRQKTNENVPKILLIFDEVQELFRSSGEKDHIASECVSLLEKLVTQGRAFGIHVILASQDFKLAPGIDKIASQMAVRIAIRGSEESAKSVLGDGNPGVKQLQDRGPGAALYNNHNGREESNTYFQVAYLEDDLRNDYLAKLDAIQNTAALAKKYAHQTRILLTNAEDDIYNDFNRFIIEGKAPLSENGGDRTQDKLYLTVGDGFDLTKKFRIPIEFAFNPSLLLIGRDEKKAASMFYFLILSVLLESIGRPDGMGEQIYLIDLSAESEFHIPENVSFTFLSELFPEQIRRVGMRGTEELLDHVYETMQDRLHGKETTENKKFFMFFGMNRAHRLSRTGVYEDSGTGEQSSTDKFLEIAKHGAKAGIATIVWGDGLVGAENIFGLGIERYFSSRIVFSSDGETMSRLANEIDSMSLRESTAVYMDIENDVKNTHFRPYGIPARIWVERIARAYREYGNGGTQNG